MIKWSVFKLLSWTESYFKKQEIDSPRLTAEILLSFCLDIRRLDLYLQHDRPLEQGELTRFKALIKRRIQKEPVAYITGKKGFYESNFQVGPGVLIPRPDTELLVEKAIGLIGSKTGHTDQSKKILELGVGSGAIIVSLAQACPGHQFYGVDISPKALAMALANAKELTDSHIQFIRGSWFSCMDERPCFDLIVSNPPYIPTRDIKELAPEVNQFEPSMALDGGDDGLDHIRTIIREAKGFLKPCGVLLLEMGFDQKRGVTDIVGNYSAYGAPEFIKDLAGHNRLVFIQKNN